MKKYALFLLILILNIYYAAKAGNAAEDITVKVGLYHGMKSISFAVIPAQGVYDIYGNDRKLLTIAADKSVSMQIDKDNVKLRHNGKTIGTYSKIKIKGKTANNVFRLKSVSPVSEPWPFDDDLEVSAYKGYLKAVNIISIDKYVAGVLESEIGPANTIEFLKAKAIICRTYALAHLARHKNEGFNLCDKVHCQVYKSKSRYNYLIPAVVSETRGMFITDTSGQLITAAFSANCGGLTSNSEDVWSEKLYYLRSVTDPFCINQSHARWKKSIPLKEWNSYFYSKHQKENSYHDLICYYPHTRETEINFDKPIPLKQVRTDLKLKSTWFEAEAEGDTVILSGRGFGHGVGLCQEGAMVMSYMGYCYDEIINFYYQGVIITVNTYP